MITINILAVGNIKESFLEQGIAEYMKRISGFAKCKIIEIPEERSPDKYTPTIETMIKKKEGERLLARITPDTTIIALAVQGKLESSESLAKLIADFAIQGKSNLTFVIGGSHGLSEEVLHRANVQLSFGLMTFPHQLMRLIVVEQIYRSFKINRGEPYHK